jgi:hypothetical protein
VTVRRVVNKSEKIRLPRTDSSLNRKQKRNVHGTKRCEIAGRGANEIEEERIELKREE